MVVVDKLGEMDVTICKDSLNAMLLSGDTYAIRVRISLDATRRLNDDDEAKERKETRDL